MNMKYQQTWTRLVLHIHMYKNKNHLEDYQHSFLLTLHVCPLTNKGINWNARDFCESGRTHSSWGMCTLFWGHGTHSGTGSHLWVPWDSHRQMEPLQLYRGPSPKPINVCWLDTNKKLGVPRTLWTHCEQAKETTKPQDNLAGQVWEMRWGYRSPSCLLTGVSFSIPTRPG